MANYITGLDLVNAVLTMSGELTDGTSGYQADALTYLNLAYKGVLTGGNIYGVDVADPWPWAISKRPLILTLQPAILGVSVTTTQFSSQITFSVPPTNVLGQNISVYNWWMQLDGYDEWFQIRSHIAGSTTAYIDVPYTEGTFTSVSCTICLLDYDLIEDSVTVTSYNQNIDFTESSSVLTAVIPTGFYTPTTYATAVAAAMTSVGTQTYSCSWNSITRYFTVSATSVFALNNATGPKSQLSASNELGLDCIDLTGLNSYTSTYSLNAITRLTSPMLLYRKPDTTWQSPRDDGKIFELSFNAFVRDYPLTQMNSGTPDRFCVVKTEPSGKVAVRFNGYMYDQPTKVEIGYIPKYRALQANSSSIPILPEEHRKYLADAAAGMLLNDKVDSRAEKREALAKAGLMAMQHSNRKELSLSGQNYGRLIPRRGAVRRRWFWPNNS